MITNPASGTSLVEVADGIYRIHTPVNLPDGGGFSFNQYVVVDDAPLLYHTGMRQMFPLVREAVAKLFPVSTLRYVAFSHYEPDECGSMALWLDEAPAAQPVCSRIAALIAIGDVTDRAPCALADGDVLELGHHRLKWFDTPHVPHGWDCGSMVDETTRTHFCGDLFTQPGLGKQALTDADILEPSEGFRRALDYYSHAPQTRTTIERLAAEAPVTLACMHGSAWRGDGGAMLRRLAASVDGQEGGEVGARHRG